MVPPADRDGGEADNEPRKAKGHQVPPQPADAALRQVPRETAHERDEGGEAVAPRPPAHRNVPKEINLER